MTSSKNLSGSPPKVGQRIGRLKPSVLAFLKQPTSPAQKFPTYLRPAFRDDIPCKECRPVGGLVATAFMIIALLMGAYAIHRDAQLVKLGQQEHLR